MSVLEAIEVGQTMLPVDDPFTVETPTTRKLDWMIERVKAGYWIRDISASYPRPACTMGLIFQAATERQCR